MIWMKQQRQPFGQRATEWATAFALGGATLFLLDPSSGRRRRSQALDKAVHAGHELAEGIERTAQDVQSRAHGLAARARGRRATDAIPDELLVERVRSALGHWCSHPHAVEVSAGAGVITLRGPILSSEAGRVIRKLSRVPGVDRIVDELSRHRRAAGFAALQGSHRVQRFELLEEHWSPTARLLVGVASGGLIYTGLRAGGLPGMLTGGFGAGALLRAISNVPFPRLFGLGAGRRAIELRKELHVSRPPDEVFEFFRSFENFPRFMSHIEEVKVHGDQSSSWKAAVRGPLVVSWTARTTALEPGRLIAWKTVPGSLVRSAGIVRFQPEGGGTLVDIRLSYNPPAGAIGHAFAKLLGGDPKHLMDEDLSRLKTLLEQGKATGHETVTREELAAGGTAPDGAEGPTSPGG